MTEPFATCYGPTIATLGAADSDGASRLRQELTRLFQQHHVAILAELLEQGADALATFASALRTRSGTPAPQHGGHGREQRGAVRRYLARVRRGCSPSSTY